MTPHARGPVEAVLREAGTAAAWPATPDLRAPVLARIALAEPASRAPDRPVRGPLLRATRALALAILTLLVLAGIAAALGIRLPGFEILFVDRLPPAGTGLPLGSPVPLADAVALERPRVLVPAALPAPEVAYRLDAEGHRIVTLAYRAEAGRPAIAGSDLALTVMAVPGGTDERLVRKMLGPGSTLEAVSIDGSPGWWIAGAPHEIMILRPDGSVGPLVSALAGDTLVFARDGTLYRLESSLGRDATVAIAESMR